MCIQGVRDYFAGRTSEMDRVLVWLESRTEEVAHELQASGGGVPTTDFASLTEISQQLWALHGPLLAGDPARAGI